MKKKEICASTKISTSSFKHPLLGAPEFGVAEKREREQRLGLSQKACGLPAARLVPLSHVLLEATFFFYIYFLCKQYFKKNKLKNQTY
jgi:hypothetical protein